MILQIQAYDQLERKNVKVEKEQLTHTGWRCTCAIVHIVCNPQPIENWIIQETLKYLEQIILDWINESYSDIHSLKPFLSISESCKRTINQTHTCLDIRISKMIQNMDRRHKFKHASKLACMSYKCESRTLWV